MSFMVRAIFLLFVFSMLTVGTFAQEEDWTWWNEINGWEPGMPSWRTFLTISPGYLGPNALPVPEVKKGFLESKKQVEFAGNVYLRKGDNTQDVSGRFYYPFAGNKIAVEVYGVMFEHYSFSTEVRDERAARDKDGKGTTVGDLYFSTQVQLWKDRRFPDVLLRVTMKTASGGALDAARYTDSPGYFFDLSFSERFANSNNGLVFLPFASLGFYSWQTNDDMNLQNDAWMYSAGFDLSKGKWNFSNSLAGYNGYKSQCDCPMVYNFEVKRQLKKDALRFQLTYGLRDWTYTKFTFAYCWQWD